MLVHYEKVAAIFEVSDELRAYSPVVPSIDDAWNEEADDADQLLYVRDKHVLCQCLLNSFCRLLIGVPLRLL